MRKLVNESQKGAEGVRRLLRWREIARAHETRAAAPSLANARQGRGGQEAVVGRRSIES